MVAAAQAEKQQPTEEGDLQQGKGQASAEDGQAATGGVATERHRRVIRMSDTLGVHRLLLQRQVAEQRREQDENEKEEVFELQEIAKVAVLRRS